MLTSLHITHISHTSQHTPTHTSSVEIDRSVDTIDPLIKRPSHRGSCSFDLHYIGHRTSAVYCISTKSTCHLYCTVAQPHHDSNSLHHRYHRSSHRHRHRQQHHRNHRFEATATSIQATTNRFNPTSDLNRINHVGLNRIIESTISLTSHHRSYPSSGSFNRTLSQSHLELNRIMDYNSDTTSDNATYSSYQVTQPFELTINLISSNFEHQHQFEFDTTQLPSIINDDNHRSFNDSHHAYSNIREINDNRDKMIHPAASGWPLIPTTSLLEPTSLMPPNEMRHKLP